MNKIFILLGPTASGKSKLSMKLSKDFPFEIINADLYSIFKGLDIGTAKPSNINIEPVPRSGCLIIKNPGIRTKENTIK